MKCEGASGWEALPCPLRGGALAVVMPAVSLVGVSALHNASVDEA